MPANLAGIPLRVRVITNTVPGYREPWTDGAKAYPTADSIGAALAGMRRKRTRTMFHLSASSAYMAQPCAGGGRPLAEGTRPDGYATGHYLPRARTVTLYHYACSWGAPTLGRRASTGGAYALIGY